MLHIKYDVVNLIRLGFIVCDTSVDLAVIYTSEVMYKEMQLKDKLSSMSKEEQLKLLATNGMLVKHPIVISEDEIVGFKWLSGKCCYRVFWRKTEWHLWLSTIKIMFVRHMI